MLIFYFQRVIMGAWQYYKNLKELDITMKLKRMFASALALCFSFGVAATMPKKTASAAEVSYTQGIVTKDTVKLEKKVDRQKKEIKKLKKEMKSNKNRPSAVGTVLSAVAKGIGVCFLTLFTIGCICAAAGV